MSLQNKHCSSGGIGKKSANPGRTPVTSSAAASRGTRSTPAATATAVHLPSRQNAVFYGNVTGTGIAATGKGTGSYDAGAPDSVANMHTTSATISDPPTQAEPKCFILRVDIEVQYSGSDSLLQRHRAPPSKKILKGSLLQECEAARGGGQSYRDVVSGRRNEAKRFQVKLLNGDMRFECSSSEVDRITVAERELLRAIATDSQRFNIYQDKDLISYALGLTKESLVQVKHRNKSTSSYEEVAAVVQYIGPLSGSEKGTFFGLELIEPDYRGTGTTDGVFQKRRYFQTDPDCSLFVPISKLVLPVTTKDSTSMYENVSQLKQERHYQPQEVTSVDNIQKGKTVYLQVGNAARRGRVAFMTIPYKENEPYAVVEMPDYPASSKWNGEHNGCFVYTPRNYVFTTFVPVSSLSTHSPNGHQDSFTKEPPSSLPMKESKLKKSSEPFFATNSKQPHKQRSPYGSREKLDKASRKPPGVRRDISDSYHPASQAHMTDTSDDLQFASGHFAEGTKTKPDSLVGIMKGKVGKFKNKWNNSSKDEDGSRTSWYTESSRSGDMARANTKAREADFLEDDVIKEVVKTIYKDWRKVGQSLYLDKDDIRKIEAKWPTEEDRTMEMLNAWQKKGTGYDNISRLAEACRNCKFVELADDLEQGLDEAILCKIASGVPDDKARVFGSMLHFSDEEMRMYEDKTPQTLPRVRFMLARWRTRQSHNSDKIMLLSQALSDCGLRQLALEVARGLDDDIMLSFAVQIGQSWNILATTLHMDVEDILHLKEFSEDKKPYQMLMLWRRRQPRNVDVLGALAKGLRESGLTDLAYDLVQGVTDEMLYRLSTLIGDKWEVIALHLGFTKEELKELKSDKSSETNIIFNMLIKWRERHDYTKDHFKCLMEALRASSLGNTAEAFEDERHRYEQSKKVAPCITKTEEYPRYSKYTGVTDEMLNRLSKLIGGEWEIIALHLGFSEDDIKKLKSDKTSETDTIFNMLVKRRERHDYTQDLFKCLMEALRASSLGIIAEAFEEERHRSEQSKKNAPSITKTEEYPRYSKDKDRVAQNIDRETLAKVSKHLDFWDLRAAIGFPMMDAIEIENSYQENETRVFNLLDCWKRRGHGGNRSISDLLQVLAHLGCKASVIDEIMRRDAADDKEEVRSMKQLSADFFSFPQLPDEPQDEPCYPYLEVDSMVEVNFSERTLFGVIRWIGVPEGSKSTKLIAGIELESSIDHGATDGTFNKQRYFKCEHNKAIFVYLSKCRPDSRFPSQAQTFSSAKRHTSQDFGGFASPLVEGFVDPPPHLEKEFVGSQKGIQGDQNSCYLDTTLFSMFAYNSVFDPLLRRSQGQDDLQEYEKVQKILREGIVNPLRQNGFVRADRILQLRERLDQLGTTKGLMSEEKDPEEFLHTLLSEVFKSRPLLKIRHGANKEVDESNIHQIFLDKDESFTLPTVEQLLLQSFQEHNLKLVEVPSCLIVQMPRFGKDYKMYKRILPSLQLDVTNIIEKYPRQCIVCGNLAVFECSECKSEEALEDTTLIKNYCSDCFDMMHDKESRRNHHRPTDLNIPDHFLREFASKTMEKGFSEREVDEHRQRLLTPKLMDLFAVICIRTSHYVAFVKAGREKDSEWVFFDSMADRQGDQQGYNIPQISHLKDFRDWVDVNRIKARIEGKQITEIMERLLGDAYICMYSNSEESNQTYV